MNKYLVKRENMLKLLDDVRQKVESGKIEQLCIAAKQDDEEEQIVIGWSNVNPCDMQTLVSHLQCDVIFDCMRRAGM
jgi:hypothetical protein